MARVVRSRSAEFFKHLFILVVLFFAFVRCIS